jgi:small GTP-binding protein
MNNTISTDKPNMDLRGYEQHKFAIAEILRASEIIISAEKRRDWQDRLQDLFTRLAEDRFNLVVVGRFSRGKTSLMNAILATDRLPTGIVPLTSVITTVAYGSKEQVVLKHDQRILDNVIPIEALPQYITQQGNPGNIQKIKAAEVQLPAEILRRGFYFVDTPGLGSVIIENTRTTESFLPEADAFLLVTGYESPLSEEEIGFFKAASSRGRHIFVVLNKHDTVSPEERKAALAFVSEQLRPLLDQLAPKLFSVSARDGLKAKRLRDEPLLAASGIQELEDQLVNFMLTEKSDQFLLAMCDRVSDLLQELPRSAETIDLIRITSELARQFRSERCGSSAPSPLPANPVAAFPTLHQLSSCEICAHVAEEIWQFLCKYQHCLLVDHEEQQNFAHRGGFCPFHTWEYESMASPYGTCVGYPNLLDRLATDLRTTEFTEPSQEFLLAKVRGLLPTQESCVLCHVLDKAESKAIEAVMFRLTKDETSSFNSASAICLPHLTTLSAKARDSHLTRKLMDRQAAILQRMSEDLSRFALKWNGARRFLASAEESTAAQRALLALAGRRNVNFDHRIKSAAGTSSFEDGTM